MNPHAAGRLLFWWPAVRSTSLAVPGFLLLSAGLHALSFYLFQVVYPPTVSLLPPPASIRIIDPANPENAALLEWIRAEDPALLGGHIPAGAPGAAALLPLAYRPSFADAEPELRLPPGDLAPPELPPAIRPGPVGLPRGAPGRQSPESVAAEGAAGGIVFFGGLSGREPVGETTRSPVSDGLLEPARFLVAATPGGLVWHVFLLRSSGDREADALAESHLRGLRLAPGDGAGLAWGIADYFWAAPGGEETP